MINLPESTKNQYKDYNREINVIGNLYFSKKRESKNLFNINGNVNVRGNTGETEVNKNTVFRNILTCYVDGHYEYGVGQKFTNLNGKTITFSAKLYSTGNAIGGGIAIYDNNVQKYASAISVVGDYITYTYTATSDNIVLGFYSNSGTEAQFTNIQVEINSQRTDYEEYGVLVSDYNSLQSTTKNYFDISKVGFNFQHGTSYINYRLGYIELTDLYHETNKPLKEICPNMIAGETYTLSFTKAPDLENNYWFLLGSETAWFNNTSHTITQAELDSAIVFYGGAYQTTTLYTLSNIQIELGSVATSYEPYNKMISKNLFNAKEIFTNFVDGDNFKFSKENSTYNITNKIDIKYLNMKTQTNYVFSYNIISNKNNYDTKATFYYYDSNSQYITEQNSSFLKAGLQILNVNAPSNAKYIIIAMNGSLSQETNTLIVNNIQLTEGQSFVPYEKYNSTPFKLNEENDCQILDFNINEKADIYYTSLPYNTMTINVNNEQGYFTEEAPHSILDNISKDGYIDLFMKINNDNYHKIMTMDFSAVKYADYKKARLEFTSCLYKINNSQILYDKYKIYNSYRNINFQIFQNYIYDNYNVNFVSDHQNYNDNLVAFNTTNLKLVDLKSMVLLGATRLGLQYQGVITTNNYNNELIYKIIEKNSKEEINQNMQLEKAIIKKDNIYKSINHKQLENSTFVATSSSYEKTIYHKLQSKRDVIIYRDTDYKITDISQSDITVSGNVNVTLEKNENLSYYNLIFIIEGDIDTECYISINKSNIYRTEIGEIKSYGYSTNMNDEDRTLIVNESSPNVGGIYIFLYVKKPVVSYIETKIMGLPYLEIGDTVEVELDNKKEKITITDIDMNFGDGLTETIKGYKFDWQHIAPYPYDDLNE